MKYALLILMLALTWLPCHLAYAANYHIYKCSDTFATFSSAPQCVGRGPQGTWKWVNAGESIVDQNVDYNAAPSTTYFVTYYASSGSTGNICVGVGNDKTVSAFKLEPTAVTDLSLAKGTNASNAISFDNRTAGASGCGSAGEGDPNFTGNINYICISNASNTCPPSLAQNTFRAWQWSLF